MFQIDNPLVAIVNGLPIIFALVGLILLLGDLPAIVSKRIAMGTDMPYLGTSLSQPCILMVAGIAYIANLAFIHFGWLSEEKVAVFLTIDLAIASLSIGLILLTTLQHMWRTKDMK
jgi:hypothetical protein